MLADSAADNCAACVVNCAECCDAPERSACLDPDWFTVREDPRELFHPMNMALVVLDSSVLSVGSKPCASFSTYLKEKDFQLR